MAQARLTLIDTSSWIEALRRSGSAGVRDRVALLMRDGRAAWCDMVTADLVIAACALTHGAEMDHCDAHFDVLASLPAGE